MKRNSAYSDGYDGNYGKQLKINPPTVGVFQNTRSRIVCSYNFLDKFTLLTIFSACDCNTLLYRANRACKYWNTIISDPNYQKGILYRTIHEGRVDIHRNKGNFGLARKLCQSASNDLEYFENLDKKITREIRESTTMLNVLTSFMQKNGLKCISCIQSSLTSEPAHPDHLNQLQTYIHDITIKILDFMDEDKTRLSKGYPTMIADLFQKLLLSFDLFGKIKISTMFQLFLKAPTYFDSFIKMVQADYACYFNIICYLCNDPSLSVRKEASLVAALMAIRFPTYQNNSWILFLDTLHNDPVITQYLIETIDRNHCPDGFRVLDIPHRMTMLLASNNLIFISCLHNNLHKFITFLENLFSSNTISAKASAAIMLLMISFNPSMMTVDKKKSRIEFLQSEFNKSPDLIKKIVDELSSQFFQINITAFVDELKITFPSLEMEFKKRLHY